MGALLALIPSRDWFYGACLVALGILLIHERHEGAAHETAALAASTAKLSAQTAAQTAELKARATMAEQAYDKEIATLHNRPPVDQPVRLCLNSGSRPVVPPASGKVAGNAGTSAAPGTIQQVPAGDSGVRPEQGPDLAELLDLLANRADTVSAELREYQSR